MANACTTDAGSEPDLKRERSLLQSAQAAFLDAFAVLYEDIAAQVRAEGLHPTQARIADRLGVQSSTLSEWRKRHHRGISLDIITRVAHRAGLSVADLFSEPTVLRERLRTVSVSLPRTDASKRRGRRKARGRATVSPRALRKLRDDLYEITLAVQNIQITANAYLRLLAAGALDVLGLDVEIDAQPPGEDGDGEQVHRKPA